MLKYLTLILINKKKHTQFIMTSHIFEIRETFVDFFLAFGVSFFSIYLIRTQVSYSLPNYDQCCLSNSNYLISEF